MILQNKKLVFVIILICICFVVIPLGFFFRSSTAPAPVSNASNTIIIDNENSYSSGINSGVFTDLANAAYTETSLNFKQVKSVYHATIRGGTFQNTSSGVSFILDIPSLKVSWSMSQSVDSSGAPQSDSIASCVTPTQAIYPLLTGCMDQATGFETPAQVDFSSIISSLPLNGPTYSITYGDSTTTSSGYTLIITYYTPTGQQDALNALQALGYTPTDYPITYVNSIQ